MLAHTESMTGPLARVLEEMQREWNEHWPMAESQMAQYKQEAQCRDTVGG